LYNNTLSSSGQYTSALAFTGNQLSHSSCGRKIRSWFRVCWFYLLNVWPLCPASHKLV